MHDQLTDVSAAGEGLANSWDIVVVARVSFVGCFFYDGVGVGVHGGVAFTSEGKYHMYRYECFFVCLMLKSGALACALQTFLSCVACAERRFLDSNHDGRSATWHLCKPSLLLDGVVCQAITFRFVVSYKMPRLLSFFFFHHICPEGRMGVVQLAEERELLRRGVEFFLTP